MPLEPVYPSGSPEHKQDQEGLLLHLDNTGYIVECSKDLFRLLGTDEVIGMFVSEIAISNMPWIRLSPEHWPRQLPFLEFYTNEDDILTLSGVLRKEVNGWSVGLIDLTDIVRRKSVVERQLRLKKATARYAEKIRRQETSVETVMSDWLEVLSLQLNIPWMVVLIQGEAGWDNVAHYQRTGVSVPSIVQSDLVPLNEQGRAGPFAPTLESGMEIWAVPYCSEAKVNAWLCCGGYDRNNKASCLNEEDWTQLFTQIIIPTIARAQSLKIEKRNLRYEALERLSSGGWWEYYVDTKTFQLSQGLSDELATPLRSRTLTLDTCLQMLDPLDRDLFLVGIQEVEDGSNFVHSLRFLRGKTPVWYRFEGVLVGEGDDRRILGFAFDVSSLHRREEEANTVMARLGGLVDSMPGVVYVQGYHQGAFRFEFCSSSLKSITGWTPEQWQLNSLTSLIHPDDRDIYLKKSKQLLQHSRVSLQYRVRCENGCYKWLQDEAKLLRDNRGVPVEAVGLYLDVTEIKEASEKILRSEESYRALVDDSPAIIFRFRPDLSVIFANASLASGLNISTDEVENLDFGTYMSTAQRDEKLLKLSQLSVSQPTISSEICIQRPDMEKRWWVLYERGLFDENGSLIEVQAVGRDNTEVHQTRQQLFQSAKMASLGEMATGLAHEINQPLSVIQMTLTNLMVRAADNQVPASYLVEKLNRISSQVVRAAGIVKHVCIFGRWSGVDGVPFAPGKCVEGALSLLGQKLELLGIEVLCEGLEKAPVVSGQPDRLEQVFVNILINAAYALSERKKQEPDLCPRIRISALATEKVLTLSVEDNGGGIPELILKKVFDTFFTTKPVDHGTGLGLSVSKEIVKQMSGRLLVKNAPDGAIFSIELPLLPPASLPSNH